MPRVMFDTSCIVPTLQPWHVHHRPALDEYNARKERGESFVLAAHTCAEAYAVLTRLPPPDRVAPDVALASLTTTFVQGAEIVALDGDAYLRLLQGAPERAIVGGRIYDAIIVECAIRARVDTILTFNERHFAVLVPPSIRIVVPN